MRDRLIELIDKALDKHTSTIENYVHPVQEWIADYLLENGVIVPPVRVGQKVYYAIESIEAIAEGRICEIIVAEGEVFVNFTLQGWFSQISHIGEIGKTVFLTREEAEAKLKGGVQE